MSYHSDIPLPPRSGMAPASRHSELLYPAHGRKNDPTQSNYSPMAQFSAATLQDHEEAAGRLRKQQESIVEASAQLAAQEAQEVRDHEARLAALAKEESDLLHQLSKNKQYREQLEYKSAEETTRRKETIEVEREEEAELRGEDASLEELAKELQAMVGDLNLKLTDTVDRLTLFRDETARGMSVLEHDRHEAQVMVATTTRLNPAPGGVDPARPASPSNLLPHQRADVSRAMGLSPSRRDVSPARHHQPPVVAAPVVPASLSAAPRSPYRGTGTTMFASPQRSPARSELVRAQVRTASPERRAFGASSAPPSAGAASSLMTAVPHRRPAPAALSPGRRHHSPYGLVDASQAPQQQSSSSFHHNTSGVVAAQNGSVVLSPMKAGKANKELAADQSTNNMQGIQQHAHAQGPASPPSIHQSGAASEIVANDTAMFDPAPTRLHELVARVTSNPGAHENPEATVEDTLRLIRTNPALVNNLDSLGNTPLHVACAVDQPSLEVVHALLLAGCSANVANTDGLTAFHVACLNTSDVAHKLKKFLLFKAAQNPNARTGKGETAAHLCCDHDKHIDALKFLSTVGVDMSADALLTGVDGNPRRMTPLDKARAAGPRASQCRAFLETLQ